MATSPQELDKIYAAAMAEHEAFVEKEIDKMLAYYDRGKEFELDVSNVLDEDLWNECLHQKYIDAGWKSVELEERPIPITCDGGTYKYDKAADSGKHVVRFLVFKR